MGLWLSFIEFLKFTLNPFSLMLDQVSFCLNQSESFVLVFLLADSVCLLWRYLLQVWRRNKLAIAFSPGKLAR